MGERATNPNEEAYLALLRDVRKHGRRVPTRAKLLSTGEPVDALSVFGRQVRYDLRAGFPLMTTKWVNFDAVAHELVWFLSGSTNIGYLREHGVRIWDAWADEDGEVGPIYGANWRAWPGANGRAIDQIDRLAGLIEAARDEPGHPAARRLLLLAWNADEPPAGSLPPCHVVAQFHVDHGARTLSCQFYQRSADLFLGVPFNVASYALLTHVLAHTCDLGVGDLIHSIGDAHIYANHVEAVEEQLGRWPLPPPALWLDPGLGDIDDFRREDADAVGYESHPALRGEVAV